MSGESYMESDFYNDSAYTADISTKMRVPDRLTAHGGVPGEEERLKPPNCFFKGTSRNGDPHIVEETGGHMYGMQVFFLQHLSAVADEAAEAEHSHFASSFLTAAALSQLRCLLTPNKFHLYCVECFSGFSVLEKSS